MMEWRCYSRFVMYITIYQLFFVRHMIVTTLALERYLLITFV